MAEHLDETTGVEGDVLGILDSLHLGEGFLVEGGHGLEFGLHGSNGLAVLASGVLLDLVEVSARGDVADGGNHLQLGRTLIDAGDAGVTVDALTGVVTHEAATAVNLHAVVGVLVAELARHALGQRREGVGQAVIGLHGLALLGGEGALTADGLERLVHVDKAGALIQQGARSVQLGLDVRDHLAHGREVDNCLAELLTAAGIGDSLLIGGLAHADALGSDAQTGTVHQRHHILDETQLAVTAQFSLGVLEHEFAGGAAVDAHLVLDAAHGHAAVALVVDEHRQATAVAGALLAACEHERDVTVTVGDEALHAVQAPSAVLVLGSLEHHRLQVAAGIGLGEVHGQRLALAGAGQEALLLVLVGKLVDGFGAVLQTPHVDEARIGTAHHVGSHDVGNRRHVQASVLAGQGDAHQASLVQGLEVLLGALGIAHTAVLVMRTLEVHILGIGSDDVTAHLADDVQHALIGVHRVLEVEGSVVEFLALGIVALAQCYDLLHQRMTQVILERFIVGIKVSHFFIEFLVPGF